MPPGNIAQHQTTTGMTSFVIACASVARPGPNDFPLLIESTAKRWRVAKISTFRCPIRPGSPDRSLRGPATVTAVSGYVLPPVDGFRARAR